MRFRRSSKTAELNVGVFFLHVHHLKDELLDPRPMAFEQRAGFRKTMAYDAVVHEGLAESFALEAVGEGGAERYSSLTGAGDADREAFVVEICLRWISVRAFASRFAEFANSP